MKIIIISRQYYPYGMASVNRLHCYTQGYVELGFETRVIIPEATIPYSERKNTKNKKAEGYYKGTYFKYMSGTPIRNKIKWKRPFLDIISRLKTILYTIKECNQETVLYIWGGGIIWCPIMQICGHLKGSKVYIELNELPYGTGLENWKTRLFRYFMLNNIFPYFDGFITISESLKQLVEQHNHKYNCTLKVPILVNTDTTSNNAKNINIDTPFIFHSGSLYEQKDGIVKMLTAFAIAKQEIRNLKFYLTGKLEQTRDEKKIKATISQYNIEKDVVFLGYLDNDTLHSYQKSCTLMIIYKYDTLQNKYCFSTKLGEYLTFAKPIILTNIGEATYYMKDRENAFIIDWEDTKKIADCIIEIINNPQLATKIGIAGRETCRKEFNYLIHAKKMIEFYKQKMN